MLRSPRAHRPPTRHCLPACRTDRRIRPASRLAGGFARDRSAPCHLRTVPPRARSASSTDRFVRVLANRRAAAVARASGASRRPSGGGYGNRIRAAAPSALGRTRVERSQRRTLLQATDDPQILCRSCSSRKTHATSHWSLHAHSSKDPRKWVFASS